MIRLNKTSNNSMGPLKSKNLPRAIVEGSKSPKVQKSNRPNIQMTNFLSQIDFSQPAPEFILIYLDDNCILKSEKQHIMNKILVPTDFSDTAYNALLFAGDLALKYDSEIILLNCYQLPQGNSSVMIDLQDILEQDSKKGLEEQKTNFLSDTKYSELTVTTQSLFGYLNECARNLIKLHGIDAVIMGTTGAETTSNKIFGSNTSKLMKKLNIPLFIVPKTKKLDLSEMVYSLADDPSNYASSSTFVKSLAKSFESKLHLCNVYKNKESIPSLEQRNEFGHFFNGMKADVHFVENEDISEGIMECSQVVDCGLIVMVRKHYGFFENLLHKSSTRKMAVYADKPLLILDEELYAKK